MLEEYCEMARQLIGGRKVDLRNDTDKVCLVMVKLTIIKLPYQGAIQRVQKLD